MMEDYKKYRRNFEHKKRLFNHKNDFIKRWYCNKGKFKVGKILVFDQLEHQKMIFDPQAQG